MNMQKNGLVQSINSHRYLLLAIVGVIVANLVSNLFEKTITEFVGNLMYIPVTAGMLVFSYKWFFKSNVPGTKNRLGGLFLILSFTSWAIAEYIWITLDLVLHQKTFPSLADVFYLSGYVFAFVFIVFLIFPLRHLISINIKVFSATITTIFIVSIVFITYQTNSNENQTSLLLSLAYPILDSILLLPCLVGVLAFHKTIMDNPWKWVMIGIISLLVGDTIFLGLNMAGTYYVGTPSESFFYCAYIMFAYSAYYSLRYLKNKDVLAEEVEALVTSPNIKSKSDVYYMTIVGVISTVAVLITLGINGFKDFSLSQTAYFLPIMIIGVALAISSRLLVTFLSIRIKKIKHEMRVSNTIEKETIQDWPTIQVLQRKVQKLEKSRHKIVPLLFVSMIITVASMTYYATNSLYEEKIENRQITSGKFLIQNLKGDIINTWVTWDLAKNEPLHVTIVNSNALTSDKLYAIKSAILSEQSIEIKNSLTGKTPADSSETYYNGWTGALKTISVDHTRLFAPTQFVIHESDDATGDIVIILSTDTDTDGTLGFTKGIADEKNHQLLKSFITIFSVNDLSDSELSAVVRHEFGHALGLGHSTASDDLMNPHFHRNTAYISQCDLDALKSLYDESGKTQIMCTS